MNLIEFHKSLPKTDKDIVIFDIDDTLFDPYSDREITPVINFYRYLVENNYNVAIITARENTPLNVKYTIDDLERHNIRGYKFLVLRNPSYNDLFLYKKDVRKQIAEFGFTPLISIGDKRWDMGEYGGIGILVMPYN
jgi:hypothetical protein